MHMEDLVNIARTDIKNLSDDEFVRKYKTSKERYQAVTKTLDWLGRLKVSLEHQEDLDIDKDVIINVEVLQEDLQDLLVRMHSANMWDAEDEDDE